MPQTIRIKRRAAGGASGAPASLGVGEPAYSEVDSILYIGLTSGSVVAIGGTGAFVTITNIQTISGDKTFSGSTTFSGSVALGASASATTPPTADNNGSVATTAFVKAQGYITANQSITISGDVTGTGTTAITATIGTGVVTNAKLATVATSTIKGRATAGTGAPEDLTAAQVKTILAIAPADVTGFDTQVRTSRLDQMAAPTAAVSMNTQRIINLAAPTADNDAARKIDVDSARSGLDVKVSCRVATTANITLSGPQTIDGISVVAGDRVLVKNQTTAAQNGIYVCAAGAWTRATDADSDAEVTAGMFTFIEEGTTNADTGWVLSTNQPITVGTTSLAFTQFSGAGSGVPGNYAGQTTITTLGTITTGTWNATTIAAAYGGTGLTSVLNGLVKGNGTAYSVAVAGTDYLTPSSDLDGGTF
jgi:hypothetical protein